MKKESENKVNKLNLMIEKLSKNKTIENDWDMSDERIEAIGKYMQNRKKIPKEKIEGFLNYVLENIIFAIVFMAILYIINIIGTKYLKNELIYYSRIISFILMIISIIFFEYSYKRKKVTFLLHGIEILSLSVCTLVIILLIQKEFKMYKYVSVTIAFIFSIYFLAKSIVIYIMKKRGYFKSINDIKDIIKNEKFEEY